MIRLFLLLPMPLLLINYRNYWENMSLIVIRCSLAFEINTTWKQIRHNTTPHDTTGHDTIRCDAMRPSQVRFQGHQYLRSFVSCWILLLLIWFIAPPLRWPSVLELCILRMVVLLTYVSSFDGWFWIWMLPPETTILILCCSILLCSSLLSVVLDILSLSLLLFPWYAQSSSTPYVTDIGTLMMAADHL